MSVHRPKHRAWAPLVLLFAGCATVPALVQVYKPPENELSDIRYVEVETFTVAETVAKQSGENISGPLKDELRNSKRFVVVDRVGLDRVRDLNKARQEGLLESDRPVAEPLRLRAPDAILRGNVVAYKSETSAAPGGAPSHEVVHQVVYDPLSWALHSIHGFRQQELVQLEGSVAITYQLIDARTGVIRCSGEALHTQRRLYVRQLASGGEQDRLLRELSRQCVQDVVNKLVRHKATELVVFAAGGKKVQEGIGHARDGDWSQAQACWAAAAEANPNDHAALYDLGLAHLAHLESDEALGCFRRAAELHPCPLYESAVGRQGRQAEQERLADIEFAPGGDKTNLGIAFARDGDWVRAEAAWRKAIAEQPTDHAAFYNLGVCCQERGDLKEALRLLTRASELNNTNRLYQRGVSEVAARIPADQPPPSAPGAILPVTVTAPCPP